ncbi:RNA-directed DNA polymerase [Clostridiaceae bacterium 14S0207]|nr:RNA-directed DNA polymerase [Clostridiaceae bacterium 14S0207]
MNNSNKLQGKQTTQYRGRLAEGEVELQDKRGARSNNLALAKRERENNVIDDTDNLLEMILARENMPKAMKRVVANKGSHGIDGMKTDEFPEFIIKNWITIKQKLLEGRYKPSPVRRVEIPKPDGGTRLLEIPTVLDRLIQQAIAQELNKANIMLDEVDKELEKRGHRFCRFADDCNIYVKSKKAGIGVMASIRRVLEDVLKLRVNENKSAVDFVTRRKFLGFSFYFAKSGANIRIHEKSYKRFINKIRKLTNRNKVISIEYRIYMINQLTIGWINYFGVAKANAKIQKIDSWIRRRLRGCIWKQWKKVKTRGRNLIKLGLPPHKAWEYANTRKGYWRIYKNPFLDTILNNKYIENLGYRSISKGYQLIHNF